MRRLNGALGRGGVGRVEVRGEEDRGWVGRGQVERGGEERIEVERGVVISWLTSALVCVCAQGSCQSVCLSGAQHDNN